MKLAGLDIGTTGSKIVVFDDSGKIADYYRSYPSLRTGDNECIDVLALKEAVFALTKQALMEHPDILGIGVTSFGEAFVMLDENDRPLFDCMLYSDPRGSKQAKWLEEKLCASFYAKTTGQKSNGMFSFPKLLYVKENHPEIFAKCKRVMLMEDYVVYLLTGVAQIDYSLAARTQCFNVFSLAYERAVFDAAGISMSLFSKPVKSGTIAGSITKKVQEELGIMTEAKIVSASHDQVANLLGSNAFSIGFGADGLGTCECITPIFGKDVDVNVLASQGYGVIPTPVGNCCYALINTSGAALDWFVNSLCPGQEKKAALIELSKELDMAPSFLEIHPHFAGRGTPLQDGSIYASINGLTLSSSRQDLFNALCEGLCYQSRWNIETLEKAGVKIKELFVSGGGSINEKWLQMRADILGIPLHKMAIKDAGTVGAIAMTASSLGIIGLEEACKRFNPIEKTFYPRPEKKAIYDERYPKYLEGEKQ